MIELGNKVRCRVTGFEGIATGMCTYLNGCVQFLVRPRVKEDGKFPAGEWLDHANLEVIDGGIVVQPTIGGPQDSPPGLSAHAPR